MPAKGEAGLAAWALVAPFAAMLSAFVIAYQVQKLRLDQVALVLDRRAGSKEQLVTWFHLRGVSAEIRPLSITTSAARTAVSVATVPPERIVRLPVIRRLLDGSCGGAGGAADVA